MHEAGDARAENRGKNHRHISIESSILFVPRTRLYTLIYRYPIIYFDIPIGSHRYFFGPRRIFRVFCPGLYRLMPSGAEPMRNYREICVK